MKVYVLTRVENYEQEEFVTIDRESIFEKLINDCEKVADTFNEIGWYLAIWEDEKKIGDHNIMDFAYDNSKLEIPLPVGVLLNNIIENRVIDKFTTYL